ncbi:hypothetical protein [Bacillus toyonensis]|uniref:hypothetical protein n=1 Tax=Bacillus toyonensis TaxID=155322 RepID=UPI002E24FF65|nr:hypothetical protein [Bacillus toyonensis]
MEFKDSFHLAEADLELILNEKGEPKGTEVIPEEVMSWYKETMAITGNWYQKLVKREDEYGIFAVLEFIHPGMKNLNGKEINDWGSATADQIINNIAQMAKRIKEKTKLKDIYVGRATGTNGQHEIGLFFKFGMTREQQEQVFVNIDKNTDYIFQLTN